jgi:hypothetical protein
MRVRSLTCTTLIERKSPSPMSWPDLPTPFTVFGKSKAIRGGFATVKLVGGLASGAFVLTLIRIFPRRCVTVTALMAF